MEIFRDYAYYYNIFYKDKDYRAEAAVIDKILKKYNRGARDLINLGCGTGMHDMEFARLGYHCKGIDISPLMIDIARENTLSDHNIEFEVGDIRNYTTNKKYDAALSLFHVISYQSTNEDVINAFKTARRTLNDVSGNSYFLFDVWYGPGVLSDKPGIRVKEVEDDKNRLIRIARPVMHDKKNLVDINYEVLVIDKKTDKVQTINEVHHMRYFFRPELEKLLSEAGFELVENIDCQTLEQTDYTTWTSYFIARAVY